MKGFFDDHMVILMTIWLFLMTIWSSANFLPLAKAVLRTPDRKGPWSCI